MNFWRSKYILYALVGVTLLAAALVAIFSFTGCKEHSYGQEVLVGKSKSNYAFRATCANCGDEKTVYYEALLTFVDDDAKADALRHWENIIDATGVPMTSAIPTGLVQAEENYEGYWSFAGWDTIERLMNKGVDFVSHTHSHTNLTKFTEEEIRADLALAKQELLAHGIETDILVYPNNARNELVLSVVPDYFDAAVACGGEFNVRPWENPFQLYRVNINSASSRKLVDFGNGVTAECDGLMSVDTMKEYVNKAVRNRAWLVFMTHAYDSPGGQFYFGQEEEQMLIEFIQYVQGLDNVKIISLTDAVEGLVIGK